LLQDHAAAFEEWKQQQMQQLEADKAALAEEAAARRDAAAARLTARQHGPQDRDDEGGADGNDSAGEQAGEPVDGAYEEMEDDDSAPAAEAAADEAYGTAAEEQHGIVPAGESGSQQLNCCMACWCRRRCAGQPVAQSCLAGSGRRAVVLFGCSAADGDSSIFSNGGDIG